MTESPFIGWDGDSYGSSWQPPGIPFATLAAAKGVTEFACDYVGQTPLAKGYGTFPTYHVRRVGHG